MPHAPRVSLRFTPQLSRFLELPEIALCANTLELALRELKSEHEQLLSYIVDDNFKLRLHVAVFINGKHLRGDDILSTELRDEDEVFFMQALSGG